MPPPRKRRRPVVLLSPGLRFVYDQFKDFEQRGDMFRALVAKTSSRGESGP